MAYDWDTIKRRYPQVPKYDKDDMDKRNSLRNFNSDWSKGNLRATEKMKNDWINHIDSRSHDDYGENLGWSNEDNDEKRDCLARGIYDYDKYSWKKFVRDNMYH
jgi:hypothetical protein